MRYYVCVVKDNVVITFSYWGKGFTSRRIEKLGWVVRKISNVAFSLVGKFTTCSRSLLETMSKTHWLTLWGYWLLSMVRLVQSISGALKSPPAMKMFFLFFFFSSEKVLIELSSVGGYKNGIEIK